MIALNPDIVYIALPFLFMLVIIYGGLEMASVFKNKRINVLISLILAVFAVSSVSVVEFIYSVLPYATIFFMIVFILGYLKNLVSNEKKDYALLIIVLGIAVIFIAGQMQDSTLMGLQDSNLIGIAVLVFIILIFYFAYKLSSNG